MKTKNYFSRHNLSVFVLLLISFSRLEAQNLSSSTWEGYFMNDYRTVLKFIDSDEVMSGTVQMFSGDNMIQNDRLSEIEIVGNSLSFYIEAKETQFKGKFEADHTILTGNFIFPDGSRHPFSAERIPNSAPGFDDEGSRVTEAQVNPDPNGFIPVCRIFMEA